MNSRLGNFSFWFLAVILLSTATAAAQQQSKIQKVGWLSTVSGPAPNFGQGKIMGYLRDLGYREGQNIAFEFRFADNEIDRLPALATELVGQKVDVLVTPGTVSALALRKASKTIPIIFLDVTDPVAAGLVDSLARPGRNLTGFSSIESVLAGKRLELLKETLPKLSRVAVLWNPQNPSSVEEWNASQRAAHELSLQLYSLEVGNADQYPAAFNRAARAHSGALSVLSTPLAASNQELITSLAAKHRLPAIYVRDQFVTVGGLMSYGADQNERFRRAAALIDKILKGAKPADIPVEQPTKFEFVINLKTAKQIGLAIPPNVLARADKVIR